MQDKEDEELVVYLYQRLKGRRYLIVMDDMWDTEIWDAVRRSFPDDGNGSRVLLTTRISDVAEYANSCSSYHMHFLNEEDSWSLLCRKVFGEGACPLELEKSEKRLYENVEGFPLSIVVMGCEGFLKSNTSKMMEDVAEGYLKDLVERSLFEKENLLHVFKYYDAVNQDTSTCRRLSIHPDDRRPQEIYNSIHSIPQVRSLLCLGEHFMYPWFVYSGFWLLRVLDLSALLFHELPLQVTELVNLRYLGSAVVVNFRHPYQSCRIETLVYLKMYWDQSPLLPREIWVMPKLRHLCVLPSCFLDLAPLLPNNSFRLENLQTLSEVRNCRCSSDIIERIPNLRRLKILFDESLFESCSSYQLENLATLHKLETLTLRIEFPIPIPHVVYPGKLAFPLQLRKLTLRGLNLPWCNMTIIGTLPNLEVLKLLGNAFRGPEWRSIEGEFCQLKLLVLECLDIVQWRADDTHFPRLQKLTIRSCDQLEEIPSCIGDISTLQLIELVDCHPSAMTSAQQIQEDQQSLGNNDLEVRMIQTEISLKF
ncbi:UNVERIFIED_CONTAM: putative late blight resistance proteinR1A-10 [Sesamum calycinum]|uniref:Late blight resistance proteinR1A-10 n=1 Tax=Sesamum calycinum TaxID=2727403 RepID=A0AAW2PRF5_9LAMI